MLHVCRIKDGKAWFANRFVQTERLKIDEKYGKPLHSTVNTASSINWSSESVLFGPRCRLFGAMLYHPQTCMIYRLYMALVHAIFSDLF